MRKLLFILPSVLDLAAQFSEAMKTPFALRWTPHTARFIGIFLLLYGGAILFYYTGQKNTRPGEEHGSASWGSVRELDKKYRDKDASQNVILVRARRDSSKNQTSCLPMRVLSSLTQRAKCSVPSEICFWRKVMFCAFLT